ncbi:MAG: helix-turn-helix transcriptional regulator [Selenomonadaceae bacterium]|nr:helix-turn-helix transcriptional regulator [Selenomonadaceae bacterium]
MTAKDTQQLENELTKADDVKTFLDNNAENFRKYTLAEYLNRLLEDKNLSKSQIIRESQLDEGYAYHIFGGRKNPSREKILSLALAMKLSPKETDYLLYYAGHNKLYARDERDAVIIFALETCKSVLQANELLEDLNMPPLICE